MSMPGLDAHLERGYTDQRDPDPSAEQYARAEAWFLKRPSSQALIHERAVEIFYEDVADDDGGCVGDDHDC